MTIDSERYCKNCSEEYKRQREAALKDRKRSKFVASKGSFTISSPMSQKDGTQSK